jgi:hypothetical protein
MAKKARKAKSKKIVRKEWSKAQLMELRGHSKARTPVVQLEKIFKRASGTIRQKARAMGLSLGHTKRRKTR